MIENRSDALYASVSGCGFYPSVVAAGVRRVVGDEPVQGFLVRTDVHVDSTDGLQMEGQVAVATEDRLAFWGAYEQPGDEGEPATLNTHSRVFPMRKVSDVRVYTTVSNPAEFTEGDVPDTVRIVLIVDQMDHLDFEPFVCDDPDCGGGHGSRAEVIQDALVFYESRDVVGDDQVLELLAFADTIATLAAKAR